MQKKELKKKNYNNAPLPFMGQKRRFLNEFKKALNNYPSDAIYVDLFGGSGLLSHTVKQFYPSATVVYNDYDNYKKRLDNIEFTNKLIADIRFILKNAEDNKRIVGLEKEAIIKRVEQEQNIRWVDYITLSSSILFSMKYVLSLDELKKQTFYNTVKQSDYNADGYLQGLDIVKCDYKELFNRYTNIPNVVFLVDPPYLSTEVGTYTMSWKLKDYLDVLQVLDGTNYFYFTSNKSSIIELCEWIETKTPMSNPFSNAIQVETKNPTTSISSFTDIMLHKKWTSNSTL